MRPRNAVQSILVHNEPDNEGNFVPLKLEVGSWICLQPGKIGGHASDAKKHGGTSIRGSYKAKVLQFRVSHGGKSISAVRVQHAYMRRQLDLPPTVPKQDTQYLNYLYLSDYENWVSPQSILGVIVVTHAEIGELTRGNRSHSQLLEDTVFFYDALYRPRRGTGFGSLEIIPLPAFDSLDWPLPDMATTESFRAKLWQDFQNSMRPSTSNKETNISWFMPIGVFVDLFYVATNMRRTKVMFVYKEVTEELCASLMDKGWDTKVTRIRDAEFLKTTVARGSLSFRYHISRSTLYASFVYNRHRLLPNKTWEPLEQYEPIETVKLLCDLDNVTHELEVGMTWTVQEIRQEIRVTFGACEESTFDI